MRFWVGISVVLVPDKSGIHGTIKRTGDGFECGGGSDREQQESRRPRAGTRSRFWGSGLGRKGIESAKEVSHSLSRLQGY